MLEEITGETCMPIDCIACRIVTRYASGKTIAALARSVIVP